MTDVSGPGRIPVPDWVELEWLSREAAALLDTAADVAPDAAASTQPAAGDGR